MNSCRLEKNYGAIMADSVRNIVDLFSGCGGFSLGAQLAGFNVHTAVDIDKVLHSSFKLNFPKTNVVEADIGKLTPADWEKQLGGERPEGIIGGPPCQGFSRIGKRSENDPRNSLIGQYFRQVEILQPKFFVMENVEGLLDDGLKPTLDKAIKTVSKEYTVLDPQVINAADYGAPTSRRRVVIVGYDKTAVNPITEQDFQKSTKEKTTVKDAIDDLACPLKTSKSVGGEFGWAAYSKNDPAKLSKYAKKMRKKPNKELGWDVAKKKLKESKSSGHYTTTHTDAVKLRFSNVEQGKTDKVSRCPRLSWTGLCPTLRAGTGSDKGSFQSVRPIHPKQDRVITVREAARLQGFPDWFVFHPTKWHSFRMIGNSVSPLVSKALLEVVAAKLK